MTELLKVAKLINGKIKEIDSLFEELEKAINEKCVMAAQYDKELATKLVELNAGKEFSFMNEKVKKPPATITEKIAKGMIHQTRLDMDLAESHYKSIISRIDAVKVQLNGYQSINRYLSEIERGDEHGS